MNTVVELIPLPYTDAVVALGAAVLGLIAGVLGTFAVLRERSLVGDALSHATLPGVCLAFIVVGAKDSSSLLVGAGLAGIVGAAFIVGIERSSRIKPDVAIGVVLSGFFSLGIVLLTYIAGLNNANQAGLEKYLFGQAAGLQTQDISTMMVLGSVSLVVVCLGHRSFKTTLFDRDFAGSSGLPIRVLELVMTALLVIAIIIGVRVVGAILMVAMLITPAVAARQLVSRFALLLPLSGAIGAGVGVTGSLLSVRWEVPTGPVIVLVGFVLVLALILGSPHRGVLWRANILRRSRRTTAAHASLLDIHSSIARDVVPSVESLLASTPMSARHARRSINDLARLRLIEMSGQSISLTSAGEEEVERLLESRALWTAWLDHGWQITLPDARDPDPSQLSMSLGPQLTAQLLQLARSDKIQGPT